jgi:RND family efflux transporter MFP subunit
MPRARNWIAAIGTVAVLGGLGYGVVIRLGQTSGEGGRGGGGGPAAIPVELAAAVRGPIEQRRVFSGSLEAAARVTIAPKVAGRIVSLPVDLADPVRRGDVIARLDGAEFEQAVAQSQAELAVSQAGLTEAENAEAIAQRELDRIRTLHERGIASDSQLDTATAEHLSRQSAVAVARARVTRDEAALQSARIRLDYATIRATWEGGDETRVVAERFVEEGDTVAANTPMLSIIELDPIDAVITATEREYARLGAGQPVNLTTDAFPGRRWEGRVSRVSPIFRAGSRQARVEIRVPNPDAALKPGMFVRAEIVLDRLEDATMIPAAALTRREGRPVVFVVDEATNIARAVEVTPGIQDGRRIQITGAELDGPIVVLGQQLLEDGSAVSIVRPAGIPGETETERLVEEAPAATPAAPNTSGALITGSTPSEAGAE